MAFQIDDDFTELEALANLARDKTPVERSLINKDYMPRIEAQEKIAAALDKAEAKEAAKRFVMGVIILAIFAAVFTMANADGKPVKVAHDEADHLVSPDMAAYIVTHAHKQLLTEYDME